jgi:hypothetical protein
MMNSATNPGGQTTEFKMATMTLILAVLTNAGWITQGQAATLSVIAPSLIFDVTAGLSIVAYILGRNGLKLKWFDNLSKGQQPATPPTFAPLLDSPAAPSYAPSAAVAPSQIVPAPSSNSVTPPGAAIAQIRSV